MPRIRFAKHRSELTVAKGANLMRSLLAADIPVASSCNGDGVCGKCRVRVLEGRENLSPESDLETHLRERYELDANERISCQAQVHGDVRVDTTYW